MDEVLKEQKARFDSFAWDKYFTEKKVVVLEVGAGVEYAALRMESEKLAHKFGSKSSKLIRLNPDKGKHEVHMSASRVNIIHEANLDEMIGKHKKEDKKIDYFFLEATALEGLCDIRDEFKKL